MKEQKLFGYNNVYWDLASQYSIAAVNERSYLKKLFSFLSANLQEEFDRFQFYIFFSHDPQAIPMSATFPGNNKVLIWFSDESGRQPNHIKDSFRIIFKNYVHEESRNVFANALGYINDYENEDKCIIQKDVSVFFAGNLNENRFPLYRMLLLERYPVLHILNVLPEPVSNRLIHRIKHKVLDLSRGEAAFHFSLGFRSGLRYPDYFNLLLRSRYVIAPRGFESSETFRHFEALSAGCILISEPVPNTSLYPDPPFLTFKTIAELQEVLKKVERGEYDEGRLVQSHKRFFESYMTVEASAKRMANICFTYRQHETTESTPQ